MWTTLFVHIRTGHIRNQGQIVQSGITLIEYSDLLEMFLSFKYIGQGTDAGRDSSLKFKCSDYLNTAVEFLEFLAKDVRYLRDISDFARFGKIV
jgi:hypothetical protein